MTVAAFLEEHADLWGEATSHPFLDGVRDGSLTAASFDRWLVQDQLFVEALLRAQAALLAGAPSSDFGVLAGGVAALADELAWFDSVASARGLRVPGAPLPAAVAYNAFLRSLPSLPYPVAISALWGVERAYLDAWRAAAPGASDYREFVEHWTVPAFADYVAGLEAVADRAVAAASPDEVWRASAAVAEVARHEAAFWAMAF